MDQNNEIKSPRVSVVIPVYNTGAYVEEAVRSIMNQTLKDIEIIIIDDGSTDNSLSVIKELAREDNRIEWISQTNKGQSVARNIGIDRARGEYIYFMDSDDFLEEDALSSCLFKADRYNVDFLLFNADVLNPEMSSAGHIDYKKPVLDDEIVYSGMGMMDKMLVQGSYRCSPCIHFIRLSHLRTLSLRFYPGIIHEDELFSALLYLQSKRVIYLPTAYFKRRFRPGSVMTSQYTLKNVNSYLIVCDQLLIFSGNLAANEKLLVHRIISYVLDPNIYRANILPFRERAYIFHKCIVMRMIRFLSMKTILVFLFPWTIQLKQFISHIIRG